MSKISSNYPDFSSSSVSIGDSMASTGVNNGVLTSAYGMSKNEADIYNYALNTLASILPQLNTFDASTVSSIKSGVDAYRNSGIENINEIYNPMINSLKNDIVSRFGNLDNSMFTDNLNDIESKRADAISSFAQDVLAKQSQLESDELTKRYALAEFLTGMANNTFDNALSLINTSLGSSNNANNYNNNLYNAISALQSTNSGSSKNVSSVISNLLGLSGNSDNSFFPSVISYL